MLGRPNIYYIYKQGFQGYNFSKFQCVKYEKNIPLAVNIDLGLKYTRVLLKGVIESTYGEEKD